MSHGSRCFLVEPNLRPVVDGGLGLSWSPVPTSPLSPDMLLFSRLLETVPAGGSPGSAGGGGSDGVGTAAWAGGGGVGGGGMGVAMGLLWMKSVLVVCF